MGTSASDASATRRCAGDDVLSDDDDDDGTGSSRPVARAVVIDATARRDADPRGFLARIVARVVAAEQGADVMPRTPGCRRVWERTCQVSSFIK